MIPILDIGHRQSDMGVSKPTNSNFRPDPAESKSRISRTKNFEFIPIWINQGNPDWDQDPGF